MQKQLEKSRYHAEVKKLDVQMDWCDKYEFGLAAFCGAMAGFIDVFLCSHRQQGPRCWDSRMPPQMRW